MKQFRLIATLGLMLSIGVALSACASEEPGREADHSSSESTDTRGGSREADPAPDASAGAADPAQCLQGEWRADNAFFFASLREFGDEFTDVSGEVRLSFLGEGRYTADYRDWRLTAVVDGIQMTILRSGQDTGVYSVEPDGTLSLQDTEVGSALTVSGAGMEMAIEPTAVSYASAQFSCAADQATVSTPDGELRLTR